MIIYFIIITIIITIIIIIIKYIYIDIYLFIHIIIFIMHTYSYIIDINIVRLDAVWLCGYEATMSLSAYKSYAFARFPESRLDLKPWLYLCHIYGGIHKWGYPKWMVSNGKSD